MDNKIYDQVDLEPGVRTLISDKRFVGIVLKNLNPDNTIAIGDENVTLETGYLLDPNESFSYSGVTDPSFFYAISSSFCKVCYIGEVLRKK